MFGGLGMGEIVVLLMVLFLIFLWVNRDRL